jgi:chromosome segregation ATPase
MLDLNTAGKPITLRGVRDRIGGGSLSTIQALLKETIGGISEITMDIESKLGPLKSAGAELIRNTLRDASEAQNEALETLRLDNETILKDLGELEIENNELKARLKELEAELVKMETLLNQSREVNKTLNETVMLANLELSKRSIREEDYKVAKAEASEARDRAAKLEGMLEAPPLRRVRKEAGNARKVPTVKTKVV